MKKFMLLTAAVLMLLVGCKKETGSEQTEEPEAPTLSQADVAVAEKISETITVFDRNTTDEGVAQAMTIAGYQKVHEGIDEGQRYEIWCYNIPINTQNLPKYEDNDDYDDYEYYEDDDDEEEEEVAVMMSMLQSLSSGKMVSNFYIYYTSEGKYAFTEGGFYSAYPGGMAELFKKQSNIQYNVVVSKNFDGVNYFADIVTMTSLMGRGDSPQVFNSTEERDKFLSAIDNLSSKYYYLSEQVNAYSLDGDSYSYSLNLSAEDVEPEWTQFFGIKEWWMLDLTHGSRF